MVPVFVPLTLIFSSIAHAIPTRINPWHASPFEAGVPECLTNGYLDADNDGIPDPEDPCPLLADDLCTHPCPKYRDKGTWKNAADSAYHEVLRLRPDDYNCMEDIAACFGGSFVPSCTSEDVRLMDIEAVAREGECHRDHTGKVYGTLRVKLRARIKVTAAERYDISIRIQALPDGGGPLKLQRHARRGKCYAFALPPDGSQQREGPGENLEECGKNEFFQRDFDRAGDGTAAFLNGDDSSSIFNFFNETLTIPCQDVGDFSTGKFSAGPDGLADIGNCNSWSVSKSGARTIAVNHEDLFPTQSSKCVCEIVNIGVPIVDTPTSLPTFSPTVSPSAPPSASPSALPSASPSALPSASPSALPSASPSLIPTTSPSSGPSMSPTTHPSTSPTSTPTTSPSLLPTSVPCVCIGKVNYLLINISSLSGDLRFYSRFPHKQDIDLNATTQGDAVALLPPPGKTSLWTEAHVSSTTGLFDIAIHTSCSQPIGPGMQFCDNTYCVTVIEGTSVHGGHLCSRRRSAIRQ